MPPERPNLLAGEELPPAPKQARSRQKREALLAAALALFAERGYDSTAIDEIARQAGVAVGAFYQHFASKRQLVLVLMDQLLEEASALTAMAGTTPASDERAAIAALVRQGLLTDWAYAGAVRAWREAALHDQALFALNRQIEAWTAGQLELMLGALASSPRGRPGIDLPALAQVVSMLFWRLAEQPIQDPAAAARLTAALTDLIAHALLVDEAGPEPAI